MQQGLLVEMLVWAARLRRLRVGSQIANLRLRIRKMMTAKAEGFLPTTSSVQKAKRRGEGSAG